MNYSNINRTNTLPPLPQSQATNQRKEIKTNQQIKQEVEEEKISTLDNIKQQRIVGVKYQKIELSPLLQSQKLMEQSEQLFDKELDDNQDNIQKPSQRSQQSESELLSEKDPLFKQPSTHLDDIVKIVMKKFNQSNVLNQSKDKDNQNSQSSFFTQQIQVQPPEGLINSIGGNVKDSSWAPSIPISTAFLKQTSLKDITLRAKAGVQAGDIQKEAHMAFALGNLNENEKNYKQAIKFYKRFFFCARILEDAVGASLGLNRLGVMYHKIKNYEKSLQFHIKHKEFTNNENMFASFYNLGIAYRLMKQFTESINNFKLALTWSQQHSEFESECISNGQLGVTYLIMKENQLASNHFEECLNFAINLKNKKLQLDCQLCLGYIAYIQNDYNKARDYFFKTYNTALSLNDKELAEQCLCNMGVALGNIQVNNMKMNFSSKQGGSSLQNIQIIQVNEDEEEDEEDFKSYQNL